jgi:hypothetical protein
MDKQVVDLTKPPLAKKQRTLFELMVPVAAAAAAEGASPASDEELEGVVGGEMVLSFFDSESGESEGVPPELSEGSGDESSSEEGDEEEQAGAAGKDEVVERLAKAVRSGRISRAPERLGF